MMESILEIINSVNSAITLTSSCQPLPLLLLRISTESFA